MKTSVTVTFTLLFLAVAGIFFYMNPFSQKVEKTPEAGLLRLLPFDEEASIQWIQIQQPEKRETITLERKDGKWMMKFPLEYPADPLLTEGLLTALKISKKARRLAREKSWEEYGLLLPAVKVGVEAEGGKKRQYLLLGDKSPVSEHIFARWESEPEYFLLDAQFKSAFDRSVYSLREKRIFRDAMNEAVKIRGRSFGGAEFEITQHDDHWFWTEPVGLLGKAIPDPQALEILLKLRDLYIKEFLDKGKQSFENYRISRTGPSLKIWFKDKPQIFWIGSQSGEKDLYYGALEGEKTVLEISKDNIDTFFRLIEKASQGSVPSGLGDYAVRLDGIQPDSAA